ncbi:MAG: methionyl-tRNA formyltransferase [Thermoguttaceae bacterium]
MRIIAMGTGGFAVPSLEFLIEHGHEIIAVVTMPQRTGQGKRPVVTPMRAAANKYGIPIHEPENINTRESHDLLYLLGAELLFVCDYGRILSTDILKSTPLGGINLHGSLLPKYRGAAPINRSILNGDTHTGVSVIHMTAKVDAGPIVAESEPIKILDEDNAVSLEERLSVAGAWLVVRTVDQMATGRMPAIPQPEREVSKAPKLRKEEAIIDWKRDATYINNHVKAMVPWPRSHTFWQKEAGKTLRLILTSTEIIDRNTVQDAISAPAGVVVKAKGDQLLVSCGKNANGKETLLRINKIQPAGKGVINAESFINGYNIRPGDSFGNYEQ